MAFPDDLTMVTVTHTIADAALRPLPGVVVATPTGRQWKQGEGSILPAEYTAPIEDGTWTLVLPAVDQFVNLEAYRIEERPTEGGKPWGRPYHIAPTLDHAPGPVDATDVITTPPRGGDIVFTAGPATDESMAQVAADPNSAFHGELTSTIATETGEQVPPLVAQALADDDTPAQAAAAAVANAVEGLDLLDKPAADGYYQPIGDYLTDETADPAMATVIDLGGETAKRIADAVNVRGYGADPTGNTSSRQALADALADANGRPVVIGPGHYRIDGAALELKSGDHLQLSPGTVLDFSQSTTLTQSIWAAGTQDPALTVAGNVDTGATTIPLPSGHGYQAGDLIRLASDRIFDPHDTNIRHGEILTIETASSGSVTITTPVVGGPYLTTENARTHKINPVRDILITGGRIIGAGQGKNLTGIRISYGVNVRIENVSFYDIDQRHVFLQNCIDSHVTRCHFESAQHGQAYGVAFCDACQDCTATDNTFIDVRHALSTNNTQGLENGIPRRIIFDRNNVRDSSAATTGSMEGGDAIDTHTAAEDIIITGNIVHASSGQGINVECRTARIEGNTVRHSASAGISVHNEAAGQGEITVRNNIVSHAGGAGISARSGGRGTPAGYDSLVVSGNELTDCAAGLAVGAPSTARMRNVKVNDNTVTRCGTTDGIAIRDADVVTVVGNIVSEAAGTTNYNAINLRGVTNAAVMGNSGELTGTGTTGVRMDNACANNTVADNRITATTAVVRGTGQGHRVPEQTFSGGASNIQDEAITITPDASLVWVDTAGLPEAVLVTIDGGVVGQRITLCAASNARHVQVLTAGRGNIALAQAGSFWLNHRRDAISLILSPDGWLETGRMDYDTA